MRPGPRAVADEVLADLPLDASPRALDDLVEDVIRAHPEWDRDPADRAAAWTRGVRDILAADYTERLRYGRQPRFAFNSSSDYMVQGPCFVERCDAPQVAAQKRARLQWRGYHSYLRELDPRRFEVLCTKVLGLLAVPDPTLTAYQQDQGIDFYGRMSVADLLRISGAFPTIESRLVVWLVGQAKHYAHSKVATPDLRELVGAATLGRARAFSRSGLYSDMRVRACDPLIMLFFATGEISRDGWVLCDTAGIVAMDGEMLAAFLADRGVGIETAGDTKAFSRDRFSDWLGGELSPS